MLAMIYSMVVSNVLHQGDLLKKKQSSHIFFPLGKKDGCVEGEDARGWAVK